MNTRLAEHRASPWRWRIGVARPEDRAGVEAVRRSAYRQAREFSWKDEALLQWGPADDAATVLAAWDTDGQVLSTVRATVLPTIAQAEGFLEYSLAGIDIAAPALVLSRAATTPAAARQGLNSLLRYAYLCGAAACEPIASVMTIVYEGGPRLNAMREAGYDFSRPCANWDSEAVTHTRALLASMPRQRLPHALAALSATLAGDLRSVWLDSTAIARAFSAHCHACSPAPARLHAGATP
ncbi:hypothetical protein [Ideonella sp. BN130291]|uniref:hypothetical protein n=1 Tax=Ideonella sp. BN130291 TaxID=3112940 RepID=UPI002E271ADF|nr:hypothetical protein [Ideonella sp. BN130291]